MEIQTIQLTDRAFLKALWEPSYDTRKKAAMIVVPGGSYLYKSRREGDPVALAYLTMNYQCFVLDYSTLWEKNFIRDHEEIINNEQNPWPGQVFELFEAIHYVRKNADLFGVDPKRIYITGFSAGGHLAASAGIFWNDPRFYKEMNLSPLDIRPNGLVLCYPLLNAILLKYLMMAAPNEEMKITGPYIIESIFGTQNVTEEMFENFDLMDKVTEDFPPAFIWHTVDDQTTLSADTTTFVKHLQDHKVPCEYHLFSHGRHGMALATPFVATFEGDVIIKNAIWPALADLFLKSLKPERK